MRIITEIKKPKKSDLFFLKYDERLSFYELSKMLDMSVPNLQRNFKDDDEKTTLAFATMFLLSAQMSLDDEELKKVLEHMKSYGNKLESSLVY